MRRTRTILCALVGVLLAALPQAAAASRSQTTLFEAPRELLSGDPALRETTLDEIRSFGVRRLRVVLYWNDVAPARDSEHVPGFNERDPAAYDWSRYDAAIGAARAKGFSILLTVTGPVPRWATAHARDHRTRPSPTRFGRFVEAAGRHYGRDVSMWSIWNEPNHPRFLLPQFTKRSGAVSGRIYRRLFQAAERGLHASGNGRDRILMGETAPRGTGRVVAPITFLRQALCLSRHWHKRRGCKRLPADGYAHHAYTTKVGPWFDPPRSTDVTIGSLRRLNRALYRAGRAHAIRKGMPIYLTEFGIQSRPDPYSGVSYTRQAEYRAIAERIAYRNRRVRMFSQYLMRDDGLVEGASKYDRYRGFQSGLRRAGGRAKRAYEAFRLPLVARRHGRRVTLWGLVRPASARARVRIEFRWPHGKRWHLLKRDRTGRRGFWTTLTRHRKGMRYRVRWHGHTGPLTRVYSRG